MDAEHSRWIFPARSSKGKVRNRVVYLTDQALEITKRGMLKYPNGPSFRNTRGQPWTPYSVDCRFKRLEKHIGRKIALYDFRHSFATRALQRGIHPVTLSVLMGHVDSTMLSRVYQHLDQNPQYLLDELRRAAD